MARRFTIMSAVLAPVVIAAILPGCATNKPASPYTSATEGDRRPAEAERLNQQAVAVIDSDPNQAEALLRESLAADLYHAPAHNNLGTLLLKQGKLYDAAQEFEWAKKLMPGHPDPRMNLALTLEIAGRSEDAIEGYKNALEVYPEHIASMQALTRIQVRTNRTDAETQRMLTQISMRGESEKWREWARLQLAKASN